MSQGPDRSKLDAVFPITEEAFQRLALFAELLVKWQKTTNLIAPSTIADLWSRHIADSLQCMAVKPQALHWLDLGSGGGFPGLVIAAVMADRDGSAVTLVESNNKKVAFLRQANRQMGARARILATRIEDVAIDGPAPQVVTARALAPLPELLRLSEKWLTAGATGLFHKGRDYRKELAECDGVWRFDLVNLDSRISPDSVLMEIRNLMRIAGQEK